MGLLNIYLCKNGNRFFLVFLNTVFFSLQTYISTFIESVLESILSSEACKSGLPSIESLLNHKFFSTVFLTLLPDDKAHLKIPCSTKEHLKNAVVQMEERLKDEQKMVRSQKRLVKVQEMMSSEEEKKKQRQKIVGSDIIIAKSWISLLLQRQEHRQLAKEQQKRKNEITDKVNGERPDSVNSSAATSMGTATPPSMSGITI